MTEPTGDRPPSNALDRATELANHGDIEGATAAALVSIAESLASIRRELEWQRRHGAKRG